jgi:hypothetical protein
MCFSRILLFFSSLVAYAQAPSADLYVSPKGNDAGSGTLASPFASVARAQAALRELRKSNPNRARTVMLRGGTYYLPLSPTSPGTLKFGAEDSGTTTYGVTWRNFPGETAVISGGEPVGKGGLGLTWKQVSGSLWQVQLPAATQPFEALFYNGERRLRARLSTTGAANLGTLLRISAEVPAKGADAACPAIAKTGRPSQQKCLDRFVYDAKDPIANWINLNPDDTSCPSAPEGSPAKKYPAGDVEVTLFNSGTVDVLRVSCVDTTRHRIYFSAKARGDSDHYDSFGPVAGHRYIVENVRDAFDAAQTSGRTGLWFLDRSTSPWTLNYLARSGENPNNDSVVIPQIQPAGPLRGSLISGLYLDCVTFSGIAFEVDNFVPPPSGFNNDETSSDTLPEAIECVSCLHLTFDGITVRHTSASGLMVTSGSGEIDRQPTDIHIVNSAFYDIGASGIRVGSHPVGSDRPNHVVQFVTVENNIVQGYGRVFPGGAGIAQANGHDETYRHNDVTDGYHTALSVCLIGCGAHTANGYNILAGYNRIWDTGGIYFNVGARDGTGAGNKILNNLLQDVSGNGIVLDNQSAAIDVENNVVLRVSDTSMVITQGPPQGAAPNTVRNNIFAGAGKSSFGIPGADPCGKDFPGNIFWRTGGACGTISGSTEFGRPLANSPLAGFDQTRTNDTLRNAGRNHPVIQPPKVPATFPSNVLEEF